MASSTVARWELARRLKLRRQEMDIGVPKITSHLKFSRNFYSAVENERAMLAADKLASLLELLEFSAKEKKELTALSKAARDRDWWESHTDLLGEEGVRLFGLEHGASLIRNFEGLAIPGILQLPDYTRALLGADPMHGRVKVEELVEIRRRRQAGVRQQQTPIVALLSEAALWQKWGTDDVHSAQLEYLLECIDTPEIDLRVLSFESHPGTLAASSTLVLFSFESAHLPDAGYQEAIRDLDFLVEGEPQFERLRLSWEDSARRAMDAKQSAQLIQSLLARG